MHSNCIRVTASRMQIVLAWLPVTGKFPAIFFKLHVTAAMLVQLQATDRQLGIICLRLAANWEQFECSWQPVQCKATSFLKARCQNNYLNQKISKLFKKSENLRDIYKLGPIHQNYACPDPISLDNSFKFCQLWYQLHF